MVKLAIEGTNAEVVDLLQQFLDRRQITKRTRRKRTIRPTQIDANLGICFQELRDGLIVQCDLKDWHILSGYNWHIDSDRYARTTIWDSKAGKYKKKYLHRMIVKPKKGFMVDHANGDGLDNRRENLRIVTPSQNRANQRKVQKGSSRFKGVSFSKSRRKWVSFIRVAGGLMYLGSFNNEVDAANVYDIAALQFFGDHACTNRELGLLPVHNPERRGERKVPLHRTKRPAIA